MGTPIGANRFSVDSSMEIPADGFRAEAPGSLPFLGSQVGDGITLEAGLDDPSSPGSPQTVRHMEGTCDEIELDIFPDLIISRVRGRDKIFELLDRRIRKQFLIEQPEEPPETDFQVGTFLASEVARDIIESAGLTLAWQCRDYTLLEDFDASGRPLEVLRNLVTPFQLVEQFRCDIFVQGDVVFVRARNENPDADYVFTAKDARINRLTIRKRRTPRWGKVTLLGKLEPTGLETQQTEGGGFAVFAGSITETSVSESRNAAGDPTSRITRIRELRMPHRIPTEETETTFAEVEIITQAGTPDEQRFKEFKIVRDERTFNEYETSAFSSGGLPTNQPKQRCQIKETRGRLPASEDPSQTFQLLETEETLFSHDTLGFQDLTSIERKSLDPESDKFFLSRRVIRTYKDLDNLRSERTETIFEPDEETGDLVITQSNTEVNAGLRPTGTRPPLPTGTGGGNQIPMEQISLEETISTEVTARDVRFSNRHMSAADLEFIMDQFRKSSGKFEYEVIIEYVSMPWLRKSNILQITGLVAEDATPIPLDPALIIEQLLEFDESGASPRMISRIRSVFWRAT